MSPHLTAVSGLGSPVLVQPRFAKRFYEPIVLLACLNSLWKDNRALNGANISPEAPQSAELAFHYFLNKLGQLCDNGMSGGSTVTAFVVLQYPDCIQYRFASNSRDEMDLLRVRDFIVSILQSLSRADAEPLQKTSSLVLRKSLAFTRPKIQAYLKSLKRNSTFCIDACTEDPRAESQLIREKLEGLRELLYFLEKVELDDVAFSQHCESLILEIDRIYRSEVSELIYEKSNEGKMNASVYWCELRHAMGRLVSYLHAIKLLVLARKRWPELFENFDVYPVPSSLPASCPFRNRTKMESLSTEDILGRMTSDPEDMKSYKASAQEFRKFGLEEKLRQEAKNVQPLVHAEVLLLDSLERDGGTSASRFFNGYKYIGCSKPTCRLCEYYFQSHNSGVEVRQGHRNLYSNWRAPDVYPDQGVEAVKAREKLMNQILVQVRRDAIRTLREKVPERKNHDSNTEPTYLIDSVHGQETGGLEHVTLGLQHLAIGNQINGGSPSSSRRASVGEVDIFAGENDYEDGDGDSFV